MNTEPSPGCLNQIDLRRATDLEVVDHFPIGTGSQSLPDRLADIFRNETAGTIDQAHLDSPCVIAAQGGDLGSIIAGSTGHFRSTAATGQDVGGNAVRVPTGTEGRASHAGINPGATHIGSHIVEIIDLAGQQSIARTVFDVANTDGGIQREHTRGCIGVGSREVS